MLAATILYQPHGVFKAKWPHLTDPEIKKNKLN